MPRPLGGSRCLVFGLDREDPWSVLRLDPGGWGRLRSLRAELDWLCHLARRGASVCAPLPSLHGRLVERVHDVGGRRYFATCLRRARGEPVDSRRPEVWNPALFHLCGRVLGQIHASSHEYSPRWGALPPHRWANRGFAWLARRVLPRKEGAVLRRIERYRAGFARLPRGRTEYGMIHADFHPGNYCLDGDRLEVFDFGDAVRGWYAADVAISLYASLLARVGQGETRLEPHASAYLVPFLRGYAEVARLGVAFEHLGDFVELYNLSIFVSFFARQRKPAGRLFEFVSEHARSGKPCLDLEFGELRALAVAGSATGIG